MQIRSYARPLEFSLKPIPGLSSRSCFQYSKVFVNTLCRLKRRHVCRCSPYLDVYHSMDFQVKDARQLHAFVGGSQSLKFHYSSIKNNGIFLQKPTAVSVPLCLKILLNPMLNKTGNLFLFHLFLGKIRSNLYEKYG